MTARLRRRGTLAVGALLLIAATVWCVHHAVAVTASLAGRGGNRFTIAYAAMFAVLVWQFVLAHLERPIRVRTRRQQRLLDREIVLAIIPAYNEDPAALRATIASKIDQSRRPDIITVVDDGSPWTIQKPRPFTAAEQAQNARAQRWGWTRRLGFTVPHPVAPEMLTLPGPAQEYEAIREWMYAACENVGIRPKWIRQTNAGKRHAQMAALRVCPTATVVWTTDSDSISDRRALAELLKPLVDPAVQSVAGIVMAANVHDSLLCRITDLWFVTGQLVDRSSLSAMGSVWVNSGPIAVYRADVLRANEELYLNEEISIGGRGRRRVTFSDDSMLTLFAMLRGKTIQQPSAFAFSLMPAKFSHHRRQFIRWMRGSFIRSLWRVAFLSPRRYAFWAHLQRWVQTATSAAILVFLIVYGVRVGVTWQGAAWMASVPILVGYAQTLRYMIIRRSDQTLAYQWGTWALTPLAVLWSMTVLRVMRWLGVITYWKTGWGTRQEVEVTMATSAGKMPA